MVRNKPPLLSVWKRIIQLLSSIIFIMNLTSAKGSKMQAQWANKKLISIIKQIQTDILKKQRIQWWIALQILLEKTCFFPE